MRHPRLLALKTNPDILFPFFAKGKPSEFSQIQNQFFVPFILL